MNLFSGSSFFGMSTGRRKPGRARKDFMDRAVPEFDEPETISVAATESLPGELARRKQQSVAEARAWLKRGLFKVGFNSGAPRLKGARKFTK